MATLKLDRVSKYYATGLPAVDEVSFDVADGEFVSLLGPSGCGKSTTLRMIAGLETISRGTLSIDGRIVNDVPARDRDIAMVFQSYALYPHMTVARNLAFGLHRRGLPKADVDRRVHDAAAMLGLEPLLARKPHSLSGGQRQRVALGRAIVRDPKVFLLDEPLSNLDASLRVSMRNEIVQQHRRLGTTMIYVTHDQAEAMTMSTRMCIMNGGRLVQSGKPLDVYRNPADTFVARFLGSPPMNLIPVTARIDGGGVAIRVDGRVLTLEGWAPEALGGRGERALLLGLRPEHLREGAGAADGAQGAVSGSVQSVEALGGETILLVDVAGATVAARVGEESRARVGDRVDLRFDSRLTHLFDPETTLSLRGAG